jgi:hypothetical protein
MHPLTQVDKRRFAPFISLRDASQAVWVGTLKKGGRTVGWANKEIERYHQFARQYISTYGERIDCADLAPSATINSRKRIITLCGIKEIFHLLNLKKEPTCSQI